MNRHIAWFGAAMILLWCCPVHAGDPALADVTQQIQERYEQTHDLDASFTQQATIRSINQTVTETGHLYFKKPHRMLWDYHTPSPKKLVINPDKAWLYVPEDNLVYVQDARKILSSKMTVRFLMGVGKLQDDFQIFFADPGRTGEKNTYILRLVPLTKDMGIDELFMTVDGTTFFITDFSFSDIYGNTTALSFTDITTNINLPDKIFAFTPPPGVNLYEVP
ncbi:MAG: outer membrane lipoprotein carrier protein LolA [Deltaproteobacteria bacterium]|nr:outer membrane lipoprotein carrier protein LolA [Deltaproteobacteria bacterium]